MTADTEERRREDPSAPWEVLWRTLAESANGLTPWAALAAALGDRDQEGAPATADEAVHRLRSAAEAWHRDWRKAMPSVEELVEIARRMLTLRHLGTPWLAAVATSPDSPWPRLGPLQAQQAQLEEFTAAADEYRRALLSCGDHLAELLERCIADLASALREAHDPQTPPTDEELLALWTEIASRRHDEALKDETFGRKLAQLTNAWSRLRLATQALLDPALESMGLPSRRQLMDTQAHLDRLKRQHREAVRRLEARISRMEEVLGEPDRGSPDQ